MKRKLEMIGAVVAGVFALAGCNRETITSPYSDGNDVIAFDTYAGGVTKTAALTTANLSTFGAAAYTGSVEIMNNQLVEGGNGAWDYTPIKYWPQSGALYFSAYAPYATASNGITPSYNTATKSFDLTYVMPADEADQVDLLMAQNVDVEDCSNRPAKVQFTFGHILSRIGLTARYTGNVSAGTTVTLTDVKISGKFMASGDYTVSGGWANQVASASTVVYDRPAARLAATALTTSAQNLLAGDDYVMVIPNGSVPMEGTITVYYTVTTPDGVSMDYVKDASSPLSYEPNKTYVYNLIIDLDADAIEFGDVTVLDWGATVAQDVDLPTKSGRVNLSLPVLTSQSKTGNVTIESELVYANGLVESAPWHAEFSSDGGETWSTEKPDALTAFQLTGAGSETFSISTVNDFYSDPIEVKIIQDSGIAPAPEDQKTLTVSWIAPPAGAITGFSANKQIPSFIGGTQRDLGNSWVMIGNPNMLWAVATGYGIVPPKAPAYKSHDISTLRVGSIFWNTSTGEFRITGMNNRDIDERLQVYSLSGWFQTSGVVGQAYVQYSNTIRDLGPTSLSIGPFLNTHIQDFGVGNVLTGNFWPDYYRNRLFYGMSTLKNFSNPIGFNDVVADYSGMFYGCSNLVTAPEIRNNDYSVVRSFYGCFEGCRSLTEIPGLDTSAGVNLSRMFYGCSSLESLPALDCSVAKYMTDTFYGCSSLVTLPGLGEVSVSVDLSSTALDHDSLVAIISQLKTISGKTLTLGPTLMAKLSADEIAVATGKGWTVE